MSALGACPLCRETLSPDTAGQASQACPACGADLKPYVALHERASQYIVLCRELVSRGAWEQAGAVLEQLATITEVDPALVAELTVRVRLAAGQPLEALSALAQCTAEVRLALAPEVQAQQQLQHSAWELYNYALTAARRGEYRLAAEQVQRAVLLAPHEAGLWRLKLKADLKCGYLERCYEDLRTLDELHARPAEFVGLERLLPPAP